MDFFHKLKSKKLQVSKTDDFGYDLRKKWEENFASHLNPTEKGRSTFIHTVVQVDICGICSVMRKERVRR